MSAPDALTTLQAVAMFLLTCFVVGPACAPAMPTASLRLITGIALSLGCAFLLGFAGYAAGLRNDVISFSLVMAGIAFAWRRRHTIAAVYGDPRSRRLVVSWLMFTGWAIGALALIRNYSGGGWSVDWVEHWQRVQFFADREPLNTNFALIYSVTARPPLANALIAIWLTSHGLHFANFQLLALLLGSLAVLPTLCLAQRWGRSAQVAAWAVLVLMLNPMVLQNVTFPWTKLPTAFFVLTALVILLEAERSGPMFAQLLAGLCLGFAMLTHYSAAPWVLAMAVAIALTAKSCGRSPWADTAVVLAAFLATLLPWIAWTVTHFGIHGTFDTNTTAAAWQAESGWERVTVGVRNLFDTLVPFPLRGEPHDGLLVQQSALGRLRDRAFNVYQINLPFALGLSGIWALALCWRRNSPTVGSLAPAERRFFFILVPLVIVLGVLVHTPRDEWGLAHICLQPLVLIGLAAAAAMLASARRWRLFVWAALAAIDVALGLALHFGLEHLTPDAGNDAIPMAALNQVARANAADKAYFHLHFLGDVLHLPVTIVLLGAAAVLTVAVRAVVVNSRRESGL